MKLSTRCSVSHDLRVVLKLGQNMDARGAKLGRFKMFSHSKLEEKKLQ